MFAIPYAGRSIPVDIPASNLIFDVGPRDIPTASDCRRALLSALAKPIDSPSLDSVVRPGSKVIIVSDDNTRLTPTRQIIPLLLDELNKVGIPDANISLIIAQGTHRAMTPGEIDQKYGPPVLSRIPILPHRYRDPDSLVSFGTTQYGTRILVNRCVVEADVKIAVGNIIPHYPTGWSGGAKALLPGVAGEETVAQMHFLGVRDPALGRVDTKMRREMEDFAEKVGLDFIINTVLDRHGRLVEVVAGHYISAHRAGVEISRQVYGTPIPRLADLTISSTSPIDLDFFQADKGIASAELATRLGGEIVLVAGCTEGISPAHPELADYVGRMSNEEIWSLFSTGKLPDPLTGAEATTINDFMAKRRITVVTEGLSPAQCSGLGFHHVWPNDFNTYLQQRLAQESELCIGILRQSAEVLPIPND